MKCLACWGDATKPHSCAIGEAIEQARKQAQLGGYYGFAGSCSHKELSEEEFVATCLKYFGGSWQDFREKLEKAQIGLFRK